MRDEIVTLWTELLIAVSLMLVLEGIWPFLDPGALRRMLLKIAEQDDRSLRIMGLLSMVTGVILLYWVN